MAFITDDKIREIKDRADIIDVISESVILKKAGVNFKGLCPFHSEKTPSFTVSPVKQVFHCFGCGAGGDVLTFLSKHQGLSFNQALQELAQRYGVTIAEKPLTKIEKAKTTEKERLFEINKKASNYFYNNLMQRDGQEALKYLEKRGITKETIETFKLGFAPDNWEAILKHFLRDGFSEELILKAGLIKKSPKNNKSYDRFRNRIIFPIVSPIGYTIGFGGRVMDDSLPKYLNSPETPLYSKSNSFYGLNLAKQEIRKENRVYIVEGYFDQIALYQHSVKNVVATLGTAIGTSHIRILKGFTPNMILIYDSDKAGIEAAKRSVPIFMQEGIDAKIVILPQKEDPDSYIFKFGKERFINFEEENLIGLFEFLTERTIDKYGLSVNGKLSVIEELSSTISSITDSLKKSLYIKHLAEIVEIEERAVIEKIDSTKTFQRGIKKDKKTSIVHKWNKIEEKVISMMLQFDEILDEVENSGICDMFESEQLKDIAKIILKNRGKDIIQIVDEEEKKSIITNFSVKDEKWNIKGCKQLIKQFILNFEQKKTKEILSRMEKAKRDGDEKLLMELFNEKLNLKHTIFS